MPAAFEELRSDVTSFHLPYLLNHQEMEGIANVGCWYIALDTLSTLPGSLFSLPLTPCVVRVGDRSLTGYEPDFCCLAFGSAAEQIKTFIGGGNL